MESGIGAYFQPLEFPARATIARDCSFMTAWTESETRTVRLFRRRCPGAPQIVQQRHVAQQMDA